MKCITILVCLLSVFTRLGAEDVKLYSESWSGTNPAVKAQTDFHISREELEKIPVWEPTAGKPAPVTRDKSVEIARKAAASQGLAVPDDPKLTVTLEKINPSYIQEAKTRPIRGCPWFYLIEFMDAKVDPPGKRKFVVTMSGALASREIK